MTAELRHEICRVGASLHARGYVHASAGNISVRLPGGGILITPTDACLGTLEPDRIALVDAHGVQAGGDRASKTLALHRRIYAADPEAGCVIHTHSIAGMAVSALDCGLLPITQTAMYFDGVGMHEYESVAIDLDEQKRLVRDLGNYKAMILRNHGLLAVGPTVSEAFTNLFWLERACKAQVQAMACNTKLHFPSQDVIEKTNHMYRPGTRRRWGPLEWPAMLRLADRKYPGFRD